MKARLAAIRDWLIGEDPGAVRLEEASRGALSTLTAGLLAILVIPTGLSVPKQDVVAFALAACFFCSLLIQDPRPADRRRTLLLAMFPSVVAVALAVVLPPDPVLQGLVFLALLFVAFAARRYGRGAGELGLLAAIAFGVAAVQGMSVERLPWFVLSACIGVLSALLWQAVIVPYDPERSLRRALRSFGRRAAATVDEVIRALEGGRPATEAAARLRRGLERIRGCRAVIEAQAGFLAPPGPLPPRFRDLASDLLSAERGLGLMVHGTTTLADRVGEVPAAVREALVRALAALRASLSSVAPPATVSELARLRDDLRQSARASLASATSDAWALPLLRIGSGGYQLALAVRRVRTVDRLDAPATADDPALARPAAARGEVPRGPGGDHPRRLHPTTILGLQAVLSAGLAMLVAHLLGLAQPAWAVTMAFLVIAGSTAESLRRIVLRIGAVLGGAILGSALSLLLPNDPLVLVGVVTICLFMALYWSAVAFNHMVLWITTASVLFLTAFGGQVREIFDVKTLTALLGGLAAALVVVWVLPIRIGPRFNALLAAYLDALQKQIRDSVGVVLGQVSSAELDRSELDASTAFGQLQQTFAEARYEYSAFGRAPSQLASQATILGALNDSARSLASEKADIERVERPSDDVANVMMALQERIHENVEAIRAFLAGDREEPIRLRTAAQPELLPSSALADAFDHAEDGRETAARRIVHELSGALISTVQLGEGLGVKVEPIPTAPGAASIK